MPHLASRPLDDISVTGQIFTKKNAKLKGNIQISKIINMCISCGPQSAAASDAENNVSSEFGEKWIAGSHYDARQERKELETENGERSSAHGAVPGVGDTPTETAPGPKKVG